MNGITFDEAFSEYLLYASARRLSPDTIKDYKNCLSKFARIHGQIGMKDIDAAIVIRFMDSLTHLSNKTLLNHHIAFSALWTWALNNKHVDSHIIREFVPRPKPEKRVVHPYTQDEVFKLIDGCKYSKVYTRNGKPSRTKHLVKYAERNRAIMLLLLDTGLRSDEVCKARIDDLDRKENTLKVMGKGDKERIVPFSDFTARAIYGYLNARRKGFIFPTSDGRSLSRDEMFKTIRIIGERVKVKGANVHRFRHTFAIEYLRNGGRTEHLRVMLGHVSQELLSVYVELATIDLIEEHKFASPVKKIFGGFSVLQERIDTYVERSK